MYRVSRLCLILGDVQRWTKVVLRTTCTICAGHRVQIAQMQEAVVLPAWGYPSGKSMPLFFLVINPTIHVAFQPKFLLFRVRIRAYDKSFWKCGVVRWRALLHKPVQCGPTCGAFSNEVIATEQLHAWSVNRRGLFCLLCWLVASFWLSFLAYHCQNLLIARVDSFRSGKLSFSRVRELPALSEFRRYTRQPRQRFFGDLKRFWSFFLRTAKEMPDLSGPC